MHIHTGRYDGEGTPKEIVDRIYEKTSLAGGILLDHDMLPPYYADQQKNITLREYGKQKGILIDGAVEITAETYIENVHLLWYKFDFSKCKEIEYFFDLNRYNKQKAYEIMCNNLYKFGYNIKYMNLLKMDADVSRLDIVNELISKKYCKNISEAKQLLNNKNIISYIKRMSIMEGIDFIHSFGGIAILAHPLLIEDKYQLMMINKAAEVGIDGFELYYPYQENGLLQVSNDKAIKSMQDIIENLSLKYQKNFLVTGGSDYHGSKKNLVKLGGGNIDENYYLLNYMNCSYE